MTKIFTLFTPVTQIMIIIRFDFFPVGFFDRRAVHDKHCDFLFHPLARQCM